MKTSDFYFDLPQELIAQDPLEDRSASRLLVLDKKTGEMHHRHFYNIADYLHTGDCLVINNTKVIPARLLRNAGRHRGADRDSSPEAQRKRCLGDPCKTGKKGNASGTKIIFGDGLLAGEVVDIVEEGNRLIQFTYEGDLRGNSGPAWPDAAAAVYHASNCKDKNRYQTVYAKYEGSAAAPTAGLHFTPELLEQSPCDGSKYRRGHSSCRTRYLPPGEGRRRYAASYAF